MAWERKRKMKFEDKGQNVRENKKRTSYQIFFTDGGGGWILLRNWRPDVH